MCEGEEMPLCVKWCLTDALIIEEREEVSEKEEEPDELEIGLEALAKKYGLQKVKDSIARMSISKKG
jgi:benzoyl-CoA reductase subunit BamC